MRFLVLGPLEVTGEGGEALPISGSKERTILADLIAQAGRVVSVDDLIDEVWGERPPRTAEKTLGTYISRLRRALEPGRSSSSASHIIVSRGDGYILEVTDDEIDSRRFERLAESGRRFLDSGRPKDAVSALEEALGLWRGTAYQGYRYTRFGTSEGERLEELRRSAEEDRVDTQLAAGDTGALIADLEAMVRDEPLRERRWGQLMLALYRSGRQAEALQAFTRARTVLVDELGIEPRPDLRRLQAAILAQDPALDSRWSGASAEPVSSTDVCPYKGLARFETSDAEFYFGRERAVADAVGHLVGGRFLALVGASGSGKSSLVRAGLLHALGSGAIPGSDRWTCALMRPGDHPLASLTAALQASVPPGTAGSRSPTRSVLIVDQFEEAFTACTDEAERTAFLDSITEAAALPDGEITVVLAMRADYYGRCAEHPVLATLVAAHQILLGPMGADELSRVIDLPAERAGLTVEDQLTETLVEHTVHQPGGLPLLSTTLLELWTRRRDRTLNLDDYLRTGGVERAVARMAEDAFGRLDASGQAAAKRILLRLAGSGDNSEVVGRRASLSEFELERDTDASRALAALTGARLITVDEGTAEVAHEALLRDWPRLRGWLEDDAEGRKLHRHVTESARAWDEGGRDEGDLYRGARLTSALDWGDANDPDLNALEREYLGASRSASEGQAVRARRTNRRTRGLLAGVAVLLALSLIVGDLALRQRDDARAAADVADARQLAAASLSEKDGIVSLLLARQAVELDDSAQTRSALLASLQRDPTAIAVMHADGAVPGDLTEWLRLSPDGHIIATGGARTTVDLFDAVTHQHIGAIDAGAETTGGDFSPDGGTLAVAAANHRIVGIDMTSRTVRYVSTRDQQVDAVRFTPNGGRLLTAESSHEQGFLVPRDPLTLEPSGAPVSSKSGPVTAMDFSGDGRWLVTTGFLPNGSRGYTELRNERDLHLVDTYGVGGNDVALSPDSRMAAIAAAENGALSQDDPLKGHLVMLNLRTGAWHESREGRAIGSQGPPTGLTGLAFSADGRSVISTGDDHRIVIWDASKATITEAFDDPAALAMFMPVLSPDGSTVFTIDVDGNIVAWDLKGDKRLGQSFDAGSSAPWFAISPDGGTLAIQHGDMSHAGRPSSIRLFDTSTMKPGIVIPYSRFGNPGLAFSPVGHTLALCTIGGYVQLWDARTGRRAGPPLQAPGLQETWPWAAAFSPDGSLLAAGGSAKEFTKGVVFLWDVATGQLVARLPEFDHVVGTVNFTPDGTRLVATTGWDNTPGGGRAIVWNIDESRVERTIPIDNTSAGPSDISNDGTTLATAGSSGKRLWDISTGAQIGPTFTGGQGNTIDLSPDGRTLVGAGTGQVVMWDVATGISIGRPFQPAGPKAQLAASFAPDGRRLFIVSDTGQAWVWDVDPTSWESRACQIAGRSLTQAEWQLYLSDRPYQATCGS